MPQDLSVVRVGPEHREAAASRLVSTRPGPDRAAGRRFVANAGALGIDLSLLWASPLDPAAPTPGQFAQACLAVLGAGRTATVFVSSTPSLPGKAGGQRVQQDRADRIALIRAACEGAAKGERGARLAQALLDPGDAVALDAFVAAGFTRLGHLAYLRRPVPRTPPRPDPAMPPGIELKRMSDLPGGRGGEGDRLLMTALAQSYIDTLDCPELAGLRDLADVVESHRAVGQYDPSLWWVVFHEGRPEGCMLLSRCPESHSVELVYLGLGPALRGRGLGTDLLALGLNRIAGPGGATLTCAVDTRNTPAQRLYRAAGFERFATRIPVIRSIPAGPAA